MKNKNKERNQIKRNFLIGVIVGGLLFTGFVGGLFITSLNFNNDKSFKKALSDVDKIIEYNKNLSYTQQVFEHCSVKENESEQLLCVNQYVVQNYNNIPREDIYSVEDMFDIGADCKSYSVYYATLANMLGYNYSFFVTPNHMMTLVDFSRGYCVLDEKFGKCIYYGEN